MKLENLKDILDIQIQEIIHNLVNNFGQRIIIVFELREKTLIGIYSVNNFIAQDEQNRKNFLIKGRKIDLISIIQKNNWQYSVISDIENIPIQSISFSDNMFGFICFGIVGY